MRWSRWAMVVPFCVACGRSRGDSGPGGAAASGGSLTSSGGEAGTGGNPTSGAPSGGSALGGAAGDSESGGADAPGAAGATNLAGSSALGGAGGAFSSGGAVAAGTSSGGAVAAGTSSGGTETEGGAPGDSLQPVRVIRGTPDEYWDLTVRGEGLDEYDGRRVLARIGNPDRPPERLGSGEAIIGSGVFELIFPAVWEADLYKTKLALIDVDGDLACDLSVDRLFQDSRASPAEVLFVSPERTAGGNNFTESDPVVGQYYCDTWFNREWPRE